MTAAILYLVGVLVVVLVCISVSGVKEGYGNFVACLWIIAIISVVVGMCIEHDINVSASDYLKSPDRYQVDTFMWNGVHYKVSNKN